MDTNYSTQHALVELLLRRDPKGCEHLCESYSAKLYGYIIRIVNDAEAAEHLLDKTFKRICRNIQQYEHTQITFLTWAMQIARTESIDYLCVTQQKAMSPGIPAKSTGEDNTAIDGASVLNMIHHGYKVYEIAEILNIPVEDVKISIRKAMKQRGTLN